MRYDVPSLQFLALKTMYHTLDTKTFNELLNSLLFYPTIIDQLKQYNEMIEKIITLTARYEGFIYGGYVRDQLAKLPFHDIDIKILGEGFLEAILDELKESKYWYTVKELNDRDYGSFNTYKIVITDYKYKFIQILIDITICGKNHINNDQCDFDINQLILKDGKFIDLISVLPSGQNVTDVIKHINNKEFYVLDAHGKAEEHSDKTHCIDRGSRRGIKLVARIDKMISRGWKCINKNTCNNPWCILAKLKMYKIYLNELNQLNIRRKNIIKSEWKLAYNWFLGDHFVPKDRSSSLYNKKYKSHCIHKEKTKHAKAHHFATDHSIHHKNFNKKENIEYYE